MYCLIQWQPYGEVSRTNSRNGPNEVEHETTYFVGLPNTKEPNITSIGDEDDNDNDAS
jgi:hypothetical protein